MLHSSGRVVVDMELDRDSFRYRVEIIIDHERKRLYTEKVKELLFNTQFKTYSYGVDIRRIERSNVIEALSLKTIQNLPGEILTLYIERDRDKIYRLLKEGYIERMAFNIKATKGRIYIIIINYNEDDYIVIKGEIIGDKIVI